MKDRYTVKFSDSNEILGIFDNKNQEFVDMNCVALSNRLNGQSDDTETARKIKQAGDALVVFAEGYVNGTAVSKQSANAVISLWKQLNK